MKLENKKALVTGSSSGIGRGIALRFAQEGADVVVHYCSRKNSALEVVDEITKIGRTAVAIQANVAKVDEIHRLIGQAWDEFGHLDILVNNAGVGSGIKSFDEITEEDWNNLINVNLRGVFFCMQTVARKMIENKIRGKIINISSVNGFQGEPYTAAYNASKGGVDMLTRSLAIELGPHGINVNGIAPGFIGGTNVTASEPTFSPVYVKHCLLTIPCKRLGEVEDIVATAVLLASDEASYIQGETIVIDGGLTIQMDDDLGKSGDDTSCRLRKGEPPCN